MDKEARSNQKKRYLQVFQFSFKDTHRQKVKKEKNIFHINGTKNKAGDIIYIIILYYNI